MTVDQTVVVTPTLRTTGRRWLFWIVAVVFVVLIAIAVLAINGSGPAMSTPLSPVDASPHGSKAVAQVLRQQGVDVATPTNVLAARSSLTDHSTLVIVDPQGFLNESQLTGLADRAAHVVLIEPTFDQLQTLAPGVSQAGSVGSTKLAAKCSLPAAVRAGTISGGGTGFRVTGGEATTCFASRSGVYSVVELTANGRRVTVLGSSAVFENQSVQLNGNAALALGVLGDQPRLVWYLPTIADSTADGATIGDLTPVWVIPVMVLLLLTVIAAGFWRGRRLGPLVIERMPVVVRANETTEGRARLYQRSASRLRALDSLRIGTVGRLAAVLGLPRSAGVDDVIAGVAAATRGNVADIRALLLDTEPTSDRELVELSDALLDLERRTTDALRP